MKKSFKIVIPIIVLLLFTSLIYAQSGVVNIQVKLSAEDNCTDHLQGEIKDNILVENGAGFLWNDQYIITAYHVVAQSCSCDGAPTEVEITIIDSEGNRHKTESTIFRETLFDIAILKLPTKLGGHKSYTLSTEALRPGDEVEIKNCEEEVFYVKEPRTVIPGVYGSHKLAASVDMAFDVGCSGSPVIRNDKVVGMAISKNDTLSEGYFIHASIIQKAIGDMVADKGEIQRVFTGTIWEETLNNTVVLKGFINNENKTSLENYIGHTITKLNNRRIRDLPDLRSAFELCNVGEAIRLTFENEINVNIVAKKRNPTDLDEIFSYYAENYMNGYSINPNQFLQDADSYTQNRSFKDTTPLSVEDLKRIYGDSSPLRLYDEHGNHHDIEAVLLDQFKFGIGVRNIYDLGLIIKTFSPTGAHLELSNGEIEMRMPGILFN